jgi:hypothetical protein
MQLTESQLDVLKPHIMPTIRHSGPGERLAPRAVAMALAALIEPGGIVASHTTCDITKPTRWTIWAVTDTRLAHVEFTFDAESYDWREDSGRERPGSIDKPVEGKLVEVSARPLSAVVELTFSLCEYSRGVYGFGGQDFRYRDIGLKFAAGSPVHIEVPGFNNDGERDRWDGLVKAIRDGMHF